MSQSEEPARLPGFEGHSVEIQGVWLLAAIRRELSPDPYLPEPHPETVKAITEFVRLMCEVSKRRPEAYRDEPWRGLAPEEHYSHACDHATSSLGSTDSGELSLGIDEDGLPHAARAGLRLAFLVGRMAR